MGVGSRSSSAADSNGRADHQDADRRWPAVELTPRGGQYSAITWSPDGDKIVYQGRRTASTQCRGCNVPELRLDIGERRRAAPHSCFRGGNSPSVVKTTADGERVYYLETQPAAQPRPHSPARRPWGSCRCKLDGTDKRTHARITTGRASSRIVSCERFAGRQVAASIDRDDAYVVAAHRRRERRGRSTSRRLHCRAAASPSRARTTPTGRDGGKTIDLELRQHYYRVPLERVIRSTKREEWQPETSQRRA